MKPHLVDDMIGQAVFVRTVTYHYTGLLALCDGQFIRLDDACWIADSGSFFDFLKTGEAAEVEPYPDRCFISMGAIVDISPFSLPLPRNQK